MSLILTLKNFGCYRNETTFNFTHGLSLLTGTSGVGKTTILDGIAFALYGEQKYRRISWGEENCKVTLTYEGRTISRTKMRRGETITGLILTDNTTKNTYNNKIAQDLIDNEYGTHFDITSYITQFGTKTFCNLTPATRMEFLKTLALGDVNIKEIEAKCTAKIKDRKKKVNECVTKLQIVSEESDKIIKPTSVEFPLGTYDIKTFDEQIKNESIKQKKNSKALITLQTILDELKSNSAKYDLKKQKKDYLFDQLRETEVQYHDISKQLIDLPKINTVEIDDRINFLNNNKDLKKLKEDYTHDSKQYQELCTSELSQMQDDYNKLNITENIVNISQELYTKNKLKIKTLELKNNIKSTEVSISTLKSTETYESFIDDLHKKEQSVLIQKIKFKDRGIVHKCPKCKTSLRIGKDSLQLADEQFEELKTEKELDIELKSINNKKRENEDSLRELKRLKSNLQTFTNEIKTLPMVDLTVDYEELYNSHKRALDEQEIRKNKMASLKTKIDNKEFSKSTLAIKKRIDANKLLISKKESILEKQNNACNLSNKDDIDTLNKDSTHAKLNNQKHEMYAKQKSELEVKNKSIQTQINAIELEDIDYNLLITEKNIEIKNLKQSDKEYKEREQKINSYIKYIHDLDIYKRWQARLEDSKKEEYDSRQNLTIAEKFMRKIKETESVAVMNIIDNINQHLQYYLDRFFTDPMIVEINSFKSEESGEEKPNVNIKIIYKGCECEVKELSGGERARVELAICLAINSLCGGTLIFLDEVLKSLDEETSEEILELLKNVALEQNRFIIMICHQAPEGLFDNVINLS